MVNVGLIFFKKIEEIDVREFELVFNIYLFLVLFEFYLRILKFSFYIIIFVKKLIFFFLVVSILI